MSLEELGLEEKDKAKAATGAAEKEGPDLKTILADKKQSALFAEQRRLAGDKDALERYTNGDYDADDVKDLEKQVKEFNALMAEADRLTNTLDGNDLQRIVDSSPDLKRIASLNKEGIREVFGKYLPDLAVRDPDHFKRIMREMSAREKTRERGAQYDKTIAEFCKKVGIDEKKYRELREPGHEDELKRLIRKQLGPWQRLWGGSKETQAAIAKEIAALPDKAAIDAYLAELDRERKAIGDALALTLVDSDTMKQALSAETQGLRLEETGDQDMPFVEVKNALKMDKAKLKEKYQKFENQNKNKPKYQKPGGGGIDTDLLRDDFAEQELGPIVKGKKGLWKDILSDVLFPNFIERLI